MASRGIKSGIVKWSPADKLNKYDATQQVVDVERDKKTNLSSSFTLSVPVEQS